MLSRLSVPTQRRAPTLCALAAVLSFSPCDLAYAETGTSAFCVITVSNDIGPAYYTGAWPGGAVLVSAEKGLYLARTRDGQVALTPATGADPGPVLATHSISGGTLIGGFKGLFLGRDQAGKAGVTAVKADTDRVSTFHDLAGAGVLVGAATGIFLAKGTADRLTVAPIEPNTGQVFEMMPFAPNAVLIAAERGWFIARSGSGKATLARAGEANTGYARTIKSLPGIGLRIEAQAGWFLASEREGAVTVGPFGDATTGQVGAVGDLPSGRMLVHAEKGWFVGDGASRTVVFTPVDGPQAGRVDRMFASRDGLVGYHAESWFVAHEKDGKITFAKSGSYRTTSDAHLYHELPGGDVLIGAYNGLFAIRPSADDPVLTKIDDHDTGYIAMLREISGQRVLADTRRGLFIVREESGKVRTTPAAMDGVSTGRILEQPRYPGHVLIELPDGTVVFGGEGGLFAGVPKACAGK